jgi:hypothetical protein
VADYGVDDYGKLGKGMNNNRLRFGLSIQYLITVFYRVNHNITCLGNRCSILTELQGQQAHKVQILFKIYKV